MNRPETPYYVIDRQCLDTGLDRLQEALRDAWGENTAVGYSYKTNTLPWIAAYFRDRGCYAEVVSDDEYDLAKALGVRNIIYNGVAKSKETFLEAVKNRQIVNVDAEYEIDWLKELEPDTYGVGIRVNFDLEAKCPGQTQCGADGERFGFCYENGALKEAIDRIEANGVRVTGLHLHKSSKTRMPDIYRAIAEAAVEIATAYDMRLRYVDIGGGFFGGLPGKPGFDTYFDMIAAILKKRFDPAETALITEPGMALIGAAVSYHTTVLDVKQGVTNTFVTTDGSRTQIDPLMTKHSYFHEIVYEGEQDRPVLPRQIIAGFTCMEHDRIFELQNERALQPGDRIIYDKTGAYTMSLSPLFIRWFPAVYVREGDALQQVRARRRTDDYLRFDTGEHA